MDLSIFYQLSLVIALAAVVSLITRAIKQPVIIGYIATGFIIGPSLLNLTGGNHDAFESFSQIGIVLLLFMIGLGLNTEVIKRTGKPVLLAIVAGVGTAGYAAASLLGFKPAECLIIAISLLFSSTIIVVKSLVDKKEQSRLYGQIAVGILLVEDIAATIALLYVATSSGGGAFSGLGLLALKAVGLAGALYLAGRYVMPRLTKMFAQSQELLYLFALAWGFGVASIFRVAGFSIEVGALFAGVALAHLVYAQEISTRLKPIRDFFVLLFFISLGEKLGIGGITSAIFPAIVFSLIIMVTKPLLTMLSLGVLGYTKQTGFKTAVQLSQISEFSIILVVLAERTGMVGAQVAVAITLTALITIIFSTYLMNYDDKLFIWLRKPLSVFERAETKREISAHGAYPLMLLGYERGGHEFVRTFRQMDKPYVVVDYDPAVVDVMAHQHISHIYGDATDLELLDELGIYKAELIISTIADSETNKLILRHVRRANQEASFICHAPSHEEADALYGLGASMVILPHLLGNEQVNTILRHKGSKPRAFELYRERQTGQTATGI